MPDDQFQSKHVALKKQ